MHSTPQLTPKARLLKVLAGAVVDRPPVICPGGMMNAAVTEVVKALSVNHNTTAEGMVHAARAVYEKTGFENYGVPFCMTCEAEPFNPNMTSGDACCEPKITAYVPWPDDATLQAKASYANSPKCRQVLSAIASLKNDTVPVIGNITGPVSTATSIVDPTDFFKALRKSPERAETLLHTINDTLVAYARAMIAAGADVIAISDPTATGEILGTHYFERFAKPLYTAFIDALEVPVIVHICGDATAVVPQLMTVGAHALSFDAIVSLSRVQKTAHTALMGNINTQLLQNGSPEKIQRAAQHALDAGVSIVSPACGLGMATPLVNLRALTDYVKSGGRQCM